MDSIVLYKLGANNRNVAKVVDIEGSRRTLGSCDAGERPSVLYISIK